MLWKLTITALVALLLVHPGCIDRIRPVPPPPPGPAPAPVVPLSLAAPFAADTDPDKTAAAQGLAGIYRNQAPAAADRTDLATVGDLDRAVRDATIQAIGALALPNTRTAIGTYLRGRIPTQKDTPLTPELRAKIKAEFVKVAAALEALK